MVKVLEKCVTSRILTKSSRLQLYVRPSAKCFSVYRSLLVLTGYPALIPILQMLKLRLEQFKELTQDPLETNKRFQILLLAALG